MHSIKRDFIQWEDKLLEVKRDFWEHHIKDTELVKEWLGADTVLRREGRIYFCETVQEAEIIEEYTNSESENDLKGEIGRAHV